MISPARRNHKAARGPCRVLRVAVKLARRFLCHERDQA
jgi:hypothetical protein